MRILFALLISISTAFGQCACDFTVTGDQVLDGVKMGVKPGQTVCFKAGTYSWLYIQNFRGEPGRPITFINECSGKVIFKRPEDGQRIVWALNDQFIRWTGTGNPAEFYGFEFIGGGQGIDFRDRSSDIEFDHNYLHDIGYSGFNAKTDPVCGKPETQRGGFTMYNIWVHDNKFFFIKTGEAAYVGESHYASGFKTATCGTLQEHDVYGVRFWNNFFDKIGRDAIQVGSCLDGLDIRDNVIKDFGMTKEYGQGNAITQNPGSKGEIHDNVIMYGSGFGICAQGRAGTKIYRNLIVGTGTAVDGGGIMTAAYAPADAAPYEIYQNTLVGINRVGLEYYAPTNLHNNIIQMPAGVILKKGGSAGVLTDVRNIKIVGSLQQLGLDANYVPTATSIVPAGTGYKDYVKPAPVVTKEPATVELITTDGIQEWWISTPSGKRKKLE